MARAEVRGTFSQLGPRRPASAGRLARTLGIAMHSVHGQFRFGHNAGDVPRSSGLMLAVRTRFPVQGFKFRSALAAHSLACRPGLCPVSTRPITARALRVGLLRRAVNRAAPFAVHSAAVPASAHGVHSSPVARPAGCIVLRVQDCGHAVAISSATPHAFCPTQNALPNWAVNRTRYGKSPWPRGVPCLSSASRPGCLASVRRLPLR